MTQSPLRGSYNFHNVTQGSPSLALGLALVAAPQLVELPSILFPVLFAPLDAELKPPREWKRPN
jgi:hypothetical protein